MEAYCMKCKTKREIQNPEATFNAKASPVTIGRCLVCGTKLYRMGRTPAHEGLVPPEPKSNRKGKLVIVESPAKAKTVGRFLGKGYTVRASVGHVRDLLRSQLSVDVDNHFTPKYRVPNEKKKVVKELKGLAKKAEEVYLATDPDREGEAIAWHLMEAAEIEPTLAKRVVFHEITEPAINEAFSHPRDINADLVNAQQARRILDRLVGYSISPILWEKVRSRLVGGARPIGGAQADRRARARDRGFCSGRILDNWRRVEARRIEVHVHHKAGKNRWERSRIYPARKLSSLSL